jgi:hypothetical protein
MTYFVMVIYLSGYPVAVIPFHDAEACGDAMPHVSAALTASHDDVALICQDSGIPRQRPVARPERGEPA